jgi:alpha-glucuronidase
LPLRTGTSLCHQVSVPLCLTLISIFFLFVPIVRGDDGYRLWLRYDPLPSQLATAYRNQFSSVAVPGDSATLRAARDELVSGLGGLLSQNIPATQTFDRDGAILCGTAQTSPFIANLGWKRDLTALGPEGYLIRVLAVDSHRLTVIAANTDVGVLYGAFHLLRLVQTAKPLSHINVSEKPALQLRALNHWDNLDGTVERGYAGRSLWKWEELPDKVDSRVRDYARANASIGINATALNNVNSNAKSLSAEYLRKAAAIADVLRPYGVRVLLSARFSAPMELGGLQTADPLDREVALWWKKKADEIYALIPDFAGFLVKANSEGQPGPRTYDRTHADGANMLAAAVAAHHGVVIWRAFVYDMKPGYDRAGSAYENLQPFDGKFASNVLLQVKNGPIDFQPREPFHPLFGAMPKTQVIPELQITQEYLGFSNHLVFLAPMWREFLDADTFAKGRGSTVTKVIDGSLYKQQITGIAGVANTGSDRNWTGHDFAQSNWYAFGRLAWNPGASSLEIASDWTRMSLSRDEAGVKAIVEIMLNSREALVDYMTPLGLHHIMWGGHHYGPAPWWDTEKRDDWNPVYYHRADAIGVGFDRTKSGSNTVSQYFKPARDEFADINKCPEKFLLWFHHVAWNHRMRSGRVLWDDLAIHYQRGVDWVRRARSSWAALGEVIDPEVHRRIAEKLSIQERDAVHWRDASLLYFQTFSKLPLPAGVEKPTKTLDQYKAKSLLELNAQ